jgi:hypothetical protein
VPHLDFKNFWYYHLLPGNKDMPMSMVSAKFSDDDDRMLKEVCENLSIDKSDALRRGIRQLWLAAQIDKPFVERAGGRPKFLLQSGNPHAAEEQEMEQRIDAHLREREITRED